MNTSDRVASPTPPSSPSAADRPPGGASAARGSVAATIALAILGIFVTYVPITAIAVALTTIGASTGASTSDLQWVSDSYIIPMAATVLSAGVFGDLHGRRRVYLLGMALTVAGAAVSALAATADGRSAIHVLWAGQAVCGLGAGLLLPTTLALIAHAVPDFRERGRYIGLWATGLVGGLAVGPLISGVILDHAGWGWIFVPTAVLALGAGAFAAVRLPESKAPEGRRLDWPGQLTASVAIAASIFGVIEGGKDGWGSAPAVIGLAVGAVAFVAFVVVERRAASPLMQLDLFRNPSFSAAGTAALVALFAVVGAIFLLSLFFGTVQELSPLEIGWRIFTGLAVTALVSPAVGLLMSRVPPMVLLTAGLVLAAVAMALLTGVGDDTGFGGVAWRMVILGIAVALMLSTVAVASISAVPHRLAGMAAATNTALRQYGGALGPAVLGVVLSTRLNDGATFAAAMHTALLVNVALLGVTAVGCLGAVVAASR